MKIYGLNPSFNRSSGLTARVRETSDEGLDLSPVTNGALDLSAGALALSTAASGNLGWDKGFVWLFAEVGLLGLSLDGKVSTVVGSPWPGKLYLQNTNIHRW